MLIKKTLLTTFLIFNLSLFSSLLEVLEPNSQSNAFFKKNNRQELKKSLESLIYNLPYQLNSLGKNLAKAQLLILESKILQPTEAINLSKQISLKIKDKEKIEKQAFKFLEEEYFSTTFFKNKTNSILENLVKNMKSNSKKIDEWVTSLKNIKENKTSENHNFLNFNEILTFIDLSKIQKSLRL